MLFCQNKTLCHPTSSCSMCQHCSCIVSNGFSESSGTGWFPHACTIWALTKCPKMAKFKTLSFYQNVFLWHQTSSCKCSMCLHCLCKVSDGFSKSSGTSWFPRACTIWALTKPLLSNKVFKKMVNFKTLSFSQKVFLWHQTSSCKCPICLYAKYQTVSVKIVVGVEFLAHALSSTIQNYKRQ